jgi:hypothetical protein
MANAIASASGRFGGRRRSCNPIEQADCRGSLFPLNIPPSPMKNILSLSAGLLMAGSQAGFAGDFSVKEKKGAAITVAYRGKPVVHLVTRNDTASKEAAHETYKVFLQVNDPLDPQRTITKGAGDKFTHHRGIYIGWSKAKIGGKSYDTWHMKGAMRQEFDRLIDWKADDRSATFTAAINWVDGNLVLLTERRTFTVHQPDSNGAFLLDKTSSITAVSGDADLNGDPEHAGCQFRATAEVVKNKSAKYLFPAGAMDQKSVIAARNLPWAAMTFKANGNDYHVQHMSHPSLPRPVRYSAYRDYGRFGSFFVTKIKKGASADFKVRFYISPGAFPDSLIADAKRRYGQYAGGR